MQFLFEYITENPNISAETLVTYEGLLQPNYYNDTESVIRAVEREKERLEKDPNRRVIFIRYRSLPSGMDYTFSKWEGWTRYTPENLRNEF